MLFTCTRCHYTFASPDQPSSCPDCGHTNLIPSTDLDVDRFCGARLQTLRDELEPQMTADERNWVRVMLCLNPPRVSFYTASHLRHYVVEAEPALRLDTYRAFRWEFRRRVKEDRIALQLEGCAEPKALLRDGDGQPIVKNWALYGAALKALYSFELSDAHKVPNLGSINKIDLEKLASEPSPAFERFLWGWVEAIRDVPDPKSDIIPSPPWLKLIK